MADEIDELLHRRTDLSTFLVHLTRDSGDASARDRLLQILEERRLRRGGPLGMASGYAERLRDAEPDFYESQQVVCLTETPLEHTWMMCREIAGRQIQFEPYGLAFTKTWGRIAGVNPVWYIDISPTGRDWLTVPMNEIIDDALDRGDYEHPIFRITPFVEQMGRLGEEMGRRPKEFWWEREWRFAGLDLDFSPERVVAVLVPEDDHEPFRQDLTGRLGGRGREQYEALSYLDPRWGLERMIAALSGIGDAYAQAYPPFPLPPR